MVYQYQPVDVMGSAMNGYNFVQGIRQQQSQQQAASTRAQALQQALAQVKADPNPQAIADFYLQFPEMKEQFDSYRTTLAEADGNTLKQVAREAIIAQKTGGNSAEVYARAAEAADRSNRPDLAQQFRDAQKTAELSPEGADLTARMFYQGLDPDGYKAVFDGGQGADTDIAKDLVNEGFQIGSPEFRKEYADRTEAKRLKDQIIAVPGIGPFRVADLIDTGGNTLEYDFFKGIMLTEGYDAAAKLTKGKVIIVKNRAQAEMLPPGTRYQTPEGQEYVR